VDFLNQTFWIRRTWIKEKEGKGKSAASRTHVPLSGKPSFLLDGMEATIRPHEANGLRFSITEAEREEASRWFTVRKGLRRALADPKTVQSLLRHANSKVTMDVYAHALDDVKLAAQERWVERVENASMVQ
jgi:integrase